MRDDETERDCEGEDEQDAVPKVDDDDDDVDAVDAEV